MSMRINAGYAIVSSVYIGESEFVLGVHLESPGQFVTWKCSDGKDYYSLMVYRRSNRDPIRMDFII